jgi:polyisoprenoid-binding protein YceI
MKKALIFVSVAFVAALFSFKPAGTIYKFDSAASNVQWKGYKVTGEHTGAIAVQYGDLKYNDAGVLTSVYVKMDMNNITCTDMGADMAGKLVGHLKSDDFLGSANYATSTFESTKVTARDTKGNYMVIGNLTIKNKTQEVKFYANVSDKDGAKVGTGKLTIDRSKFDIKYGSGSFFDGLGDKTIYDEFDLTFNIVAKK